MDHLRQTTDPTLLSAINSRYEDIFHRVLKWDPSSHSEREALARFRQRYDDSAYICRYSDCPRRSAGFATAHARKDHESIRHGQGILCSQPDCLRSQLGFRTSELLERHVQDFHGTSKLVHRFKQLENPKAISWSSTTATDKDYKRQFLLLEQQKARFYDVKNQKKNKIGVGDSALSSYNDYLSASASKRIKITVNEA